MRIKSSFKHPKVFSFKYFNAGDVKRAINNLNSKKVTPKCYIPVNILRWNSDITAHVLRECYNQNIKNSAFPNELKNADIPPVYKKKKSHYDKSNYRPVNIVPFSSKPFNVFYMSKLIAILKIYFQNIREDYEKNSALNNYY